MIKIKSYAPRLIFKEEEKNGKSFEKKIMSVVKVVLWFERAARNSNFEPTLLISC
jgi:hypothetical protein